MAKKVFTVGTASFASVTIESVVSMSFSDGGNPNSFFADGDIYSEFAWMENITPTAQVSTTDLSVAANAAFDPGDVGALVQNFPQRASGQGGKETGSTALIATWNSSTMLGPVSPNASQQGQSSLALPFTGISTDGTTNPITLSLGAAA